MKYRTIVADPPWRFDHRTGKVAPEHQRLFKYPTMSLEEICALGQQISEYRDPGAHLYLWVPTALLSKGLLTMASWGFEHKTNVYWLKVTKAGVPDRSCMGFYYRNVIEPCLFGNMDQVRTRHWNEPNVIMAPRTGHSTKPEAFYRLVERQSEGPYLELFARQERKGWESWGNQVPGRSVVLITTDAGAVQTWRELVADVLLEHGGVAHLRQLYESATFKLKVGRAEAQGHNWRAQIRRTLQRYFFPEGSGTWRAA
jgi:N6-adenosine-specific RNA methylase IME4